MLLFLLYEDEDWLKLNWHKRKPQIKKYSIKIAVRVYSISYFSFCWLMKGRVNISFYSKDVLSKRVLNFSKYQSKKFKSMTSLINASFLGHKFLPSSLIRLPNPGPCSIQCPLNEHPSLNKFNHHWCVLRHRSLNPSEEEKITCQRQWWAPYDFPPFPTFTGVPL